MTTGNDLFQVKQGAGWSRGLDSLLLAELGRWFGTKKWWIQILLWALVINAILALVVLSEDSAGPLELTMLLNIFLGVFAPFGVSILMQGAVVGEKQSGTAAWILSKPLSRPAFVLAKLIANSAGIAITVVLVQGLIAYGLIYAGSGSFLPPLGVLAGLGIQLVNLLFYITLSLALGTIFNRRGPVIGIPVAFVIAQELLIGLVPALAHVLPWTLTVPLDSGGHASVATALMTGSQPLTYLPLATTLAASALFVAIALWLVERLEL